MCGSPPRAPRSASRGGRQAVGTPRCPHPYPTVISTSSLTTSDLIAEGELSSCPEPKAAVPPACSFWCLSDCFQSNFSPEEASFWYQLHMPQMALDSHRPTPHTATTNHLIKFCCIRDELLADEGRAATTMATSALQLTGCHTCLLTPPPPPTAMATRLHGHLHRSLRLRLPTLSHCSALGCGPNKSKRLQ